MHWNEIVVVEERMPTVPASAHLALQDARVIYRSMCIGDLTAPTQKTTPPPFD